ncbi:MAG: electron-transferring-flavoprotein dehydrogenase [Candidatus Tokpelaia sp. JSC161]|jgi:electron-transferring-flavoprotein dehydrogenase|nr:MAG: electron-transferring-flavoprotein dehydrogenase [Candidatus Tokpelaia sp. JSC161]
MPKYGICDHARESMVCDVVIVGAGPAGLSAAIRLKQMNPSLCVVVLEKAAEVGAHILSGAIVDPVGIDVLLPGWQEEGDHPFKTLVEKDHLIFLTAKSSFCISNFLLPKRMCNSGNFVVSLGQVCRWLADKAEKLGVEIYSGYSAVKFLYNDIGAVNGVITSDMGLGKDGFPGSNYSPGIAILGKYVLIGEGARGSLAKTVIARYSLDKGRSYQKYGIGLKEIWEIDPYNHQSGLVQHFLGWPLDDSTGGGGFLYHLEDGKIAIGFVVHLDYKNPYLSPFEEFQRFKTHPALSKIFLNAKRVSYGARAISEGGMQSVPKLVFPGGALIGCAAGLLNLPSLKGSHNAIFSGIITAEHVDAAIMEGRFNDDLVELDEAWRLGPIGVDLFPVRNVKPLWAKYGTKLGIFLGGFDMWWQQFFSFSLFGTIAHTESDASALEPAVMHNPIEYPPPDNVLTFDRISSIDLSNLRYREQEPCHLQVKDENLLRISELAIYEGPSTRYCPAAVYEWTDNNKTQEYVINAKNCIHCKTCDIKDPDQNIDWIPPEGGSGPLYYDM